MILSAMRRSLIWAGLLVFIDAAVYGSLLFSAMVCPIWFLASVIRGVIRRPGWRLALTRLAVPVVTLLLVVANASLQSRIAEANAAKVIAAAEQFRVAKGVYPAALTDLVPGYFDAPPTAKFALTMGSFSYRVMDNGNNCTLMWIALPPFGRRIYDCKSKQWSTLD